MSTTEAISGEPQGTKLLLPFRFAPRKTKHATVQRRELLRHMSEASLLKQMLIVRGPAGSGKSTLLMQWRGVCIQMNRPIAWLTVDAADRDPKQFNAGVAEALDKAQCPQIAEGFREVAAEADRLSSIQIAHRLASICNASNERPVFLLDQYERMDGPAAGEIISGFLDHALHARVVIGSRIRPNIPLGQLLASDQLFEIGPSDLNFTPFETREIFDGNVPELYTRRLHWETSGEAVAVGFARRAVDELPRDMVGTENWHEQLHHYYRAEILDLVTPEIRAAMARLVVVERFDLSLAHALIGRSATEVVEQLHHIDGLVLRHRGTQEFYFSEMLRRFLERQLAWLEDDELIELHRRAADWFETRQRISEALRHAVAARDKQMAARLLERIGYGSLVTEQGVSAAHDLLDLIGGLSDEHMPATLLSQVLIHAHEGDMAQASAKFRAVNSLLPSDSAMDTAVENQRILAEAYITAFQDETSRTDTTPKLKGYLKSAPVDEHEGRAQAYILLSWDRYCRGDLAESECFIEKAAVEYGETESAYAYLFMHVHRTLARFWRNDLVAGLEEISLAEKMTRVFFPQDHRMRSMTAILRAGLMFELGKPDGLTDITALVGAVAAVESWPEMQIWAHTIGARVALASGMHGEARGIVSYGREVARRIGSLRFEWNMQLASINISLRTGETERAIAEAGDIGLMQLDKRSASHKSLTWQEHIGGNLVAIRIAEAEGDAPRALLFAQAAAAQIKRTTSTRHGVELELSLARLAKARGDEEAAAAHIAAALDHSGEAKPVRLFAEAGEELRPYLPSLPFSMPMHAAIAAPAAEDDLLTARERQILHAIGEGHPNKVTAYRLGLSEATVKFHLRNIYRKLNAQNRTQALAHYRTMLDVR